MPNQMIVTELRPELIRTRLQATTKQEAIDELVSILEAAGELEDSEDARQAVLKRESTMSTGMENGIAIPHGKTDSVSSLKVAMGLKPEGIDFDSADGEPSRILLMTVSPASRSGPHLRFMAEVSMLLRSASVREALLQTETPEAALDVLRGAGR